MTDAGDRRILVVDASVGARERIVPGRARVAWAG
jgi:hypothetical protein